MEFLVETAGVADGPALGRPAPECGGLGEAVVAAQALPPAGALQQHYDGVGRNAAELTTRQFLGLTSGRLVPFIL